MATLSKLIPQHGKQTGYLINFLVIGHELIEIYLYSVTVHIELSSLNSFAVTLKTGKLGPLISGEGSI